MSMEFVSRIAIDITPRLVEINPFSAPIVPIASSISQGNTRVILLLVFRVLDASIDL